MWMVWNNSNRMSLIITMWISITCFWIRKSHGKLTFFNPSISSYNLNSILSSSFVPSSSSHQQQSLSSTTLSLSSRANTDTNNNISSSSSSNDIKEYDELPLDFPRRKDALIALEAVRRACHMTSSLQPSSSGDTISTVTKVDTSPVTLADLAAQIMILSDIQQYYPNDSFLAEEDSSSIQNDAILQQKLQQITMAQDLVKALDLGRKFIHSSQTTNNHQRVWCLDPIDGTKGFLRGKQQGGQYAVALALIEDGVPTLGILGCPNLPSSSQDTNYAWTEDEDPQKRGCIFVASQGGGCYQLSLHPDKSAVEKIHVTDRSKVELSKARFCVGVEKSIADAEGLCTKMADRIHGGTTKEGEIMYATRMDSQAKYAMVARGAAEYYVRLPSPTYVENKWDHAAGKVVVEEAGGQWTDTNGDANIDFGLPGAKLPSTVRGIFASNGGTFHTQLVETYQQIQSSQNE